MIRNIFLFIAFIFYNNVIHGQSLLHSISGEIGGHAIIYGLSYDLRFKTDSLINFGFGTVGSVFVGTGYGHSAAALRGFCTVGKKKSNFETGLDVIYDEESGNGARGNSYYSISSTYLQAYLGYRYQPLKGGLLLRIYSSPLSLKINNGTTVFGLSPLGFIGVSLGYTFKSKTVK